MRAPLNANGYCSRCLKKAYAGEQDAVADYATFSHKPRYKGMRPYKDHCGWWHLGHRKKKSRKF